MRAGLFLYQVLGTLAFLFALPYLALRALRHPREMRERLALTGAEGERERERQRQEEGTGPLWIHAASLGEMEAAAAILEDSRRSVAPPVLLTVLSVSARVRAEGRFTGAEVLFAPLDLWFVVDRFLDRRRPRGLILLETELWPWTLEVCRRRGIPVVLVSGRLSTRKWSRTRRLRWLLRPAVESLAGLAVQTEGDRRRFSDLGCPAADLTGNIKYRLQIHSVQPDNRLHGEADQCRIFWVAGSLRIGEEAVLDGFASSAAIPGLTLILAPRHLRERSHWLRCLRRRDLRFVARSDPGTGGALELPPLDLLRVPEERLAFRRNVAALLGDTRILLVDRHGELGRWFAAADLGFVGGTLVPIGGHNLFEPAREGVPVAFGPFTGGVAEVAEPLLRHGGGTEVAGAADLARWIGELAADPRRMQAASAGALAAAREVAGASERTWRFLERFPWVAVRVISGGNG